MFALAINGSPRRKGNTDLMLREVLGTLESAGWTTELYQLGGKIIRGCMACGGCLKSQNQKCSNDNDCFNEIMPKIIQADALIFGSPTYFADVSAEMKALIDRAGYVAFANGRLLTGKIGAAVIAARRGGATCAYDTINHMFLMSQVIVPGSTYWNLGHGLDMGDVANDAEALANMRNLGSTIAWLGKAIKPHLADYPKAE